MNFKAELICQPHKFGPHDISKRREFFFPIRSLYSLGKRAIDIAEPNESEYEKEALMTRASAFNNLFKNKNNMVECFTTNFWEYVRK